MTASSLFDLPRIANRSAGPGGGPLVRVVQAGGHRVIATSRDPRRTPDLVREVEAKSSRWVQLDVDDVGSGAILEALEESGERIDVLVNNAGFSIHAPVETMAENELRAQMETMYFGPLRLIRAVLPHQRRRRFGAVANFSSSVALDGQGSMGGYAGAKGGLDALTKVLANEVAPFNIRVLTVPLGSFDTNMPNVYVLGKTPVPEDYKDTVAGRLIDILESGTIAPKGDKEKAMKAVYQLIVGEGFGAGKENERFLPLGIEVTACMALVQDQLAHAKEVFGEVTDGVGVVE